eukprot:CAMPEP_0117513300 /NCGR_PEP_ID=MMETSP0784-20121206/29481_1 /TAXON_ID=39447 /ORGANISM="" /LENGTH=59 /DNA_ID=CAMNT_0005309057 /DNA_START=459 /DNA_END=638 /DNA_ORIENTATION=+
MTKRRMEAEPRPTQEHAASEMSMANFAAKSMDKHHFMRQHRALVLRDAFGSIAAKVREE